MRADRLVEILLLLQQRGQVTAREVADELEISERTARRDLEALGMAGLPIYSVRGRNGGWRLLGDGRTDLSGLSSAEVRALFMVAGPQTTNPEIRSALRKLVEALPETFRTDAEVASNAIVVDRAPWGKRQPDPTEPTHLDAVQAAVVSSDEVELGYVDGSGNETRRTVVPLGLASKGNRWYFIAETDRGERLFRVDRVTDLVPTGRTGERPEGFDLEEAWNRVVSDFATFSAPIITTGRVRASMAWPLMHVLGNRVRFPDGVPEWHAPKMGERYEERGLGEWCSVEMRGYTIDSLAGECGGFGDRLEIDGPPELRRVLAEIGRALVATYGDEEGGASDVGR